MTRMTGSEASALPPLAVLAGDPRAAALVRRVCALGSSARLVDPEVPGAAILSHEWLVLPPGSGAPSRRLASMANAGRGVLAPHPLPWPGDLRVPAVSYAGPAFLWANARLTAEGALLWALGGGRDSLWGARVVVYGFGRVGLSVALQLGGGGARVTVRCRDPEERGRAVVMGYEGETLRASSGPAVLVINTIPAPILDRVTCEAFGHAARVLDLASPPGGFLPEGAAILGAQLERRSGLPGQVAPEAAARILVQALAEALASGGEHRTDLG